MELIKKKKDKKRYIFNSIIYNYFSSLPIEKLLGGNLFIYFTQLFTAKNALKK